MNLSHLNNQWMKDVKHSNVLKATVFQQFLWSNLVTHLKPFERWKNFNPIRTELDFFFGFFARQKIAGWFTFLSKTKYNLRICDRENVSSYIHKYIKTWESCWKHMCTQINLFMSQSFLSLTSHTASGSLESFNNNSFIRVWIFFLFFLKFNSFSFSSFPCSKNYYIFLLSIKNSSLCLMPFGFHAVRMLKCIWAIKTALTISLACETRAPKLTQN